MKRTLISSVIASTFVVAFGLPLAAQDAASIVGVWKLKSWENVEIESKKVNKPFGETPTGSLVFSKGGSFSIVVFGTDRTPLAAEAPTDAERAALFRSMLATYGTYKVKGNEMTLDIHGSWTQARTGTSALRTFEIKGNVLTYLFE